MRTLFGIAAMLLASVAAAQETYIVELTGLPAAAQLKSSSATKRRAALAGARAAVRSEQAQQRHRIAREDRSILASVDTVANALIVRTSPESAAELARMPGVRHVHRSVLYQATLDHALNLQHVPDAWAQIGGSSHAGASIKIGIIDTGIDASHPGFEDNTLQIPDGFPIVNRSTDIGYTNNKIIVARSYDNSLFPSPAKDIVGHGTAVAMVAAGMRVDTPFGFIRGVAPKAYLGSYKVFPDDLDGAPSELILQALDDAVKDGMDVINLSLGSLPARAIALDPLVEAVENATAAGVVVVIAAGNSGPDPNTMASPGTSPDAITVGNAANDREFGSLATDDDGQSYRVYPGTGSASLPPVYAAISDVAQFDESGLACNDFPAGSLDGKIALILRGTCTFEVKLNHAATAGATAAVVYTNDQPIATMSVGNATLPAAMVSHADGLKIKEHIASQSGWSLTLSFDTIPVDADPAAISSSSARGPSVEDTLKPDISGVGTSILTAAPLGRNSSGLAVLSGTSLSAPMITGAVALVKAARPGLSAQQYRSLVVNSARTLQPEVFDQFSILQTGSGLLDVSASLNSTVAASPVSLGFGIASGTVDRSRTLRLTNLSPSPDTLTLSVVPFRSSTAAEVGTTTLELEPGSSQDVTVRFHAAIPAPGEYQGYISIRSTQSAVETRVPYWFGAPSAAPANITLLLCPLLYGEEAYCLFRVTDASGIVIQDGVEAAIDSGDGRVDGLYWIDDEFPGVYELDIRRGGSETLVLLKAGDRSRVISIPGY